jgi:uncharacterized protein (DUF433 family)
VSKMLGEKNSLITIDPEIRGGRPTLRGTRITISQIIAEMTESGAHEDFCKRMALKTNVVFEALHELALFLDRNFSVIMKKVQPVEGMMLVLTDATLSSFFSNELNGSVVEGTVVSLHSHTEINKDDRVMFNLAHATPVRDNIGYYFVENKYVYGKVL